MPARIIPVALVRKPVLRREISREFIIPSTRDNELNFVLTADGVQILHVECIAFAGIWAFDVYNLDYVTRHVPTNRSPLVSIITVKFSASSFSARAGVSG